MTKHRANTIRKVLENKVMELGNSARRRDELVVVASADPMDRLLGASEREFAAAQLEAATKKIREAQAALQRLEEGTYGICGVCGEEISPKRLAAVPSASLCIICQEAADLHKQSRRQFLPMAA